MRLLLPTLLLVSAGALAPAADPPAKSPNPMPEQNGVRLVLAEGTGTTREDALKAAYAAAVGQVAQTLVATERLTDKDDKVVKDVVLSVAKGVVDQAKEVSAREEKGVWRVWVQARVQALDVADSLIKNQVPVRPVVAVDGATEFAKTATQLKAGKDAAAWFSNLFRDYPCGCYKVEIDKDRSGIDKRQTTETTAYYNVMVRHTIDPVAYKKAAALLTESLEFLSIKPSTPFSYVSTQYGQAEFASHSRGLGTRPDDLAASRAGGDTYGTYFVLLATGIKSEPFVVRGGTSKGVAHTISGRCYVLDKAVADPFVALAKVRVATVVKFKDKDGKVVATNELEWSVWDSRNPLPLVQTDHMTAYIQPSAQGGHRYGVFYPHLHRNIEVRLPLRDLERVTSAEAEVVVGPYPPR